MEFPLVLDMAKFLARDDENGVDGAGGDDEEAAAGASSPRSAEEEEQAEEMRRAVCFGKNGTPLEAADARSVRENGGTLLYELFAVLIHSGSAIGGHYYAYLRTGDGKWYEFNDSTISAIDVEDLEKAFGGATTTRSRGYGGYGSSYTFQSSSSAYMLMYRRKDEHLNINDVTLKDLPPSLLQELEAEREKAREAAERERAERERKLNESDLPIYAEECAFELQVKKNSTVTQLKHAIVKRLAALTSGGEDGGDGELLPIDCLRVSKWMNYSNFKEPVNCEDEDTTLLTDVKLDGWNSSVVVETKAPGDEWDNAYDMVRRRNLQTHVT